jgi:hypothetical protein
MKFPNLVWAISQHRLPHYQAAAKAEMSEIKFSRCLSGRAEFSSEEQMKLAAFLEYPAGWLFLEVSPPTGGRRSEERCWSRAGIYVGTFAFHLHNLHFHHWHGPKSG